MVLSGGVAQRFGGLAYTLGTVRSGFRVLNDVPFGSVDTGIIRYGPNPAGCAESPRAGAYDYGAFVDSPLSWVRGTSTSVALLPALAVASGGEGQVDGYGSTGGNNLSVVSHHCNCFGATPSCSVLPPRSLASDAVLSGVQAVSTVNGRRLFTYPQTSGAMTKEVCEAWKLNLGCNGLGCNTTSVRDEYTANQQVIASRNEGDKVLAVRLNGAYLELVERDLGFCNSSWSAPLLTRIGTGTVSWQPVRVGTKAGILVVMQNGEVRFWFP